MVAPILSTGTIIRPSRYYNYVMCHERQYHRTKTSLVPAKPVASPCSLALSSPQMAVTEFREAYKTQGNQGARSGTLSGWPFGTIRVNLF